jgi:hypothetical protein
MQQAGLAHEVAPQVLRLGDSRKLVVQPSGASEQVVAVALQGYTYRANAPHVYALPAPQLVDDGVEEVSRGGHVGAGQRQ